MGSVGGKGPGRIMYQERAAGKTVQDQGVWLLDGFGENGRPKSDDNLYSPPGFTIRVSSPGSLHCTPLPVEGACAAAPGGVPVTLTRCSIRRGPFAPAERAPDGLSNMPAGLDQ